MMFVLVLSVISTTHQFFLFQFSIPTIPRPAGPICRYPVPFVSACTVSQYPYFNFYST